MSAVERAAEHRAIAIQCVAELSRGLQILDVEVCRGAGRKDVRSTINHLRHLLRTLDDATMRDGRWAHWAKPEGDA